MIVKELKKRLEIYDEDKLVCVYDENSEITMEVKTVGIDDNDTEVVIFV